MFPPYDIFVDAARQERRLALQEAQRRMQLGVPLPGIGLPGWLRPLYERIPRLQRRPAAPALPPGTAASAARRTCRRRVSRPALRCSRCGAVMRRPARLCANPRRRALRRAAVRG